MMNFKIFPPTSFYYTYCKKGLIPSNLLPMAWLCHNFPRYFLLTFFVMMNSSISLAQSAQSQEIRGVTGGDRNSGDCGYISSQPNHVMQLSQQTYSLNIYLEVNQGKPSLLILGPGEGDRFCILGEPAMGRQPHMGGVWAPGKYLIYVGDANGNQNPFTLRITGQ